MTNVHVDLRVEVYHLLYDGFDLVKPTNDIAEQLCLSGPPKMTRIGRTSVKYTNDEAGVGLVWRKHGELVNDYLFPLRTEVP